MAYRDKIPLKVQSGHTAYLLRYDGGGGALWSEFPKNVQKFRNHEKSQVNKMS